MAPRGKPTLIDATVRAQMLDRYAAGWSFARIADQLNADGIPTPRGAAGWYAQSVRQVVLAEQRRRSRDATAGRTMQLRVEAENVDAEFARNLAVTVQLMARGAGARNVEIVLSGVDADVVGDLPDVNFTA
jgi:hypothetical protein